jgi:hypothetical protein
VGAANVTADLNLKAWADPFIFIDPAFPLANEFSIIVSDGVSNQAPANVPEPSSLLLLGSAVIAIAGFHSVKSRRSASAASKAG